MPFTPMLPRALAAALTATVLAAEVTVAQRPAGVTTRRADAAVLHSPAAQQSPRTTNPGAFLIEAAGGSVGSLLGIGLVGLAASCGTDDLACVITKVGAGGVLGAIGATAGTTLAAHHTGSRRSVVGAALGALTGTGVGLGIHYLLNRASDRNLGDASVVPIFVVSQGVFAAIGSRLVGSP